MSEFDLKNYEVRTDLIVESIGTDTIKGLKKKEKKYDDIKVTDITVEHDIKNLNKKKGKYITISFNDVTDSINRKKVEEVVINELNNILSYSNIKDNDSCLVVGLGNYKSTPDSLGPKVIDELVVTRHLYLINELNVEEGYRNVSSFVPGVMGTTGIEAKDVILGIVREVKPKFIIVVDALASSSIERVNKTIQMTDTGIHPGSGIGNKRKEISSDTLKKPVIAIGVPTVVDAVTIVSDTINYMYKHYSYTKDNINKPSNRLITGGVNYLKKDVSVDNNLKQELFGVVGNLNDDEVKQLIFEVLSPIGYNLMVTPKEIDFEIEKLSDIIGNGINRALHDKVDNL